MDKLLLVNQYFSYSIHYNTIHIYCKLICQSNWGVWFLQTTQGPERPDAT